ncbi:DUF1177 family protein [Streptomyces spiramenti]|uniref:DUF1177 family protein n=1 Tax=Streptomyces spiramenti TaxID=2720606 RepID=UPI003B83932E
MRRSLRCGRPVRPGLTADRVVGRSGAPARVLPVTTQDITPHGNGVHHINPCTETETRASRSTVSVGLRLWTADTSPCGAVHARAGPEATRSPVRKAVRYIFGGAIPRASARYCAAWSWHAHRV